MELITFKSETRMSYPVGSDMPAAINNASKAFQLLHPKIVREDRLNIWCRGSSGAIMSALISSHIIQSNIAITHRICHIKKDGEKSHSNGINYLDGGLNIIVDDFIDSGDTIETMVNKITGYYGLEVAGVVLGGSVNYKNFLNKYTKTSMFFIYQV